MLIDLLRNSYSAAAYIGTGLLLMVAAFAVIDALTPGDLRRLVWFDRNRNAAILVGSNLAATALVIVASINASEGRLAEGLVYTFAYSVIGIVAMSIAFLVVDMLTPGKLGDLVVHPDPHPAVWVHAVTHIGIALIICASIL
ncbi:protein of unknown function [Gordonia malaquae]|uniref:DUF350 domain-containing protein n=1 Tax=Gordonia malaquae NBRC 108250 TaxID=1223542 RepID=M3VG02_GORML|nr:DUF350 domain-containing protein [Gordonia malaquae]GAC80514.1 hypothetical protein GM1_018_00770 [Gordonia malaquae NBRC 108250]SEE17300.1 protein of unknown function [Gordonia malaquae]